MQPITRREALALASAVGATSLAGCLSDSDDAADGNGGDDGSTDGGENGNGNGDGNGGGDGDGNGNENGNGDGDGNGDENGGENGDESTEGVAGSSIESTTTEASGEPDYVELSVADGVYTVDGIFVAPNPCHEAVLANTRIDESQLSVRIDVADTSGDEDCPTVPGRVEYAATVEPEEPSAIDAVAVDHTDGGTHLVAGDGDTDGSRDPDDEDGGESSGIVDSSLETVEATCGRFAEGGSDVTVADATVTVEGWIGGLPNPCQRAYLDETNLEDGELLVSVGVRSTLDEDEVCADCIGEVSYEAEITLEEPIDAENVQVSHAYQMPGA